MYSYTIIEKDCNSINYIKNFLNDFEDYNCIGISSDNDEAMNTILKENPNLVFLNVDNTIGEPFHFIHELGSAAGSILPTFIAISSFKNKAYRAIKSGFSDLLLKPMAELDIRKTILTFQKRTPIIPKKNICLKSYEDYQYLSADQILFLKADNTTTEFHMSDGTTINSYKTLKSFEGSLPKEFLRIHRSYIINKNYVSRIQFGKHICTMKSNDHDIPFTKAYLDNINSINDKLTNFSYQFLN